MQAAVELVNGLLVNKTAFARYHQYCTDNKINHTLLTIW